MSRLGFEDTGLICCSVGCCVDKCIGLPQGPEKIKGDETAVQQGIETFLCRFVIMLNVFDQDLEMLAFLFKPLLIFLAHLLGVSSGFGLLESLPVSIKFLEISKKKRVILSAWKYDRHGYLQEQYVRIKLGDIFDQAHTLNVTNYIL